MKPKDRNIPLGRSVLILVEGDEDLFTLSNFIGDVNPDLALRKKYNQIHFFPYAQAEVQKSLGKDALRYALQELSKVPGFQHITVVGVICDADVLPEGNITAKQATTEHVKSALGSIGWAVPTSSGQWIQNTPVDLPNLKWVGFLVVPPNRDSGCLETMLWESVSDKISNLKTCAEGLLKCAEPVYAKEFPDRVNQPNHENWRDKVRVHALLAGCEEPQTHTTTATLKGYWNFEAAGLAAVLAFLREGQQRSLGS
ncbi:MAG TPA: DUF3226 domain-containing protein [Verrucomicrobiae bacterium]|jgi:hypothetical protein